MQFRLGSCIGNLFELKSCSFFVYSKLRLHILPFFWGLDVSVDYSIEMHFLGDVIGFSGQSWPKFQDYNANKRINEISDYIEVSNWVFIPLISLTSSISSLTSMGVCQKCVPETLLILTTRVIGSGFATAPSSSSNSNKMKVESIGNQFCNNIFTIWVASNSMLFLFALGFVDAKRSHNLL